MSKLILMFCIVVLLFSSCATWAERWALEHGYILAEDCPTIPEELPERMALPKPRLPVFDVEIDKIDEIYLMNMVIELFGTVEKFQFLVEIYEREYLNAGGVIMPDLTLEQLKERYQYRLGIIDEITPIEEVVTPTETTGMVAEGIMGEDLTVEEFEFILSLWFVDSTIYNVRIEDE